MKKILILGGTIFIGCNLVERLLQDNTYEITLFNRQQSKANLFPNTKKIKGDRETDDIKKISKTNWDYVIDVSCYYPDALANVLKYLNSNLKKYIFISTCSVYDPYEELILRDEEATILTCNEDQKTDRTKNSYGNRKAECERILMVSGFNYLILRPSLVYGTYDPTDRFYYWLYQAKKHKTLLLPDKGKRLFSVTYVHDLIKALIIALNSNHTNQVYNITTSVQISIAQIVEKAGKLFQADFEVLNASPEFLKNEGLAQWADMPLWLDSDYFNYSNQKIIKDLGIQLTSFNDSLINTIDYYDKLDWPVPSFGMSETKRLELIEIAQKKSYFN